ncbi:ABC transporter ATP-binding protein [Porticoccus hydrocarbonoclasticus]|uniref:ABC transporter ATP-binding protein n=1 Tax=Porticoccus hydrocarbonoclasticus TaxID=1073414 RepID=UPI00056BE309|nr:ATP-binding cassette domain-containing protein [Porticoccus hydrocarbonoclasticus]|tara:strand:- start:1782 stop:2501 length:720 start_codon:yes stop_codon:yes gene_type:complete
MTTDSTAVMHCDNLARHYRQGVERIDVLRGLSLRVHSGERIAIIGTSGSGKTTLLNLLGGLDDPDEGFVNVMGAALKPMNESKRARWRNQHLGFVYQFHHLLGEFSALENVAMPLLVAKTPVAEAKVLAREMLDRVGLGARCAHKPSELSGGERQRVAIARALVRKPACVLMDEPTGNLDPVTAETVLALLMSLNRELAISFVVVTHDTQVAARMDRVLSLTEGCLTDVTESRSMGQGL